MKSNTDFQIFREALVAAAHGPFIPDWEFSILFGLERTEVESIAENFSPSTPLSGEVAVALNGAMNNLLGYPHGQEQSWFKWLSVTPEELQAIYSRWRASGIEA